MPDFYLLRVRVEQPDQTNLWSDDVQQDWIGGANAIRHALAQNPEYDSRNRGQWHIGGLTVLDEDGYYFKVGRITKRIEPQWDPDSHDFVEVENEPAPYTHAIINIATQVCGLAMNREIAQTVPTLGRKLASLLNNSAVGKAGFRFWVTEIKNPRDFITQIQEAYAIKKFTFTVFRPNFPDPSEMA